MVKLALMQVGKAHVQKMLRSKQLGQVVQWLN